MFSVNTEEEARKLIVLCCPTNYAGEYIARELVAEQTLDNLRAFSDRLARGWEVMQRNANERKHIMAKTKKAPKKTKKAPKPKKKSDDLKSNDVAQYETERMFAAEHIVKDMLEGQQRSYVFDEDEDDVGLGSCELYGVDDARDEEGRGGAWVCVRFYVPNLDIDTEIDS